MSNIFSIENKKRFSKISSTNQPMKKILDFMHQIFTRTPPHSITPLPSELLGKTGIFLWLDQMYQSQPEPYEPAINSLINFGIEKPGFVISQLQEMGVILEINRELLLSNYGNRSTLLLRGVNRGDIKKIFKLISLIEPDIFPYEIVREGITTEFISTLESRPNFRRVYICSPWLSINKKLLHKFQYATYLAQKNNPVDIIVIVRPLDKKSLGYNNFLDTLVALKKLGADIVVNPKVHAKIFIREPNIKGGFNMAVFGSENLTGSRNIELGIKIVNNNVIIDKLIRHFFEIYSLCDPWKGV